MDKSKELTESEKSVTKTAKASLHGTAGMAPAATPSTAFTKVMASIKAKESATETTTMPLKSKTITKVDE